MRRGKSNLTATGSLLLFVSVFFIFMTAGMNCLAATTTEGDCDIFTKTITTPNVLLIIDTSSSMHDDNKITTINYEFESTKYSPTTVYYCNECDGNKYYKSDLTSEYSEYLSNDKRFWIFSIQGNIQVCDKCGGLGVYWKCNCKDALGVAPFLVRETSGPTTYTGTAAGARTVRLPDCKDATEALDRYGRWDGWINNNLKLDNPDVITQNCKYCRSGTSPNYVYSLCNDDCVSPASCRMCDYYGGTNPGCISNKWMMLRTGNYLNYRQWIINNGGSSMDYKLNVARETLKTLVSEGLNARFGLMVFPRACKDDNCRKYGGQLLVSFEEGNDKVASVLNSHALFQTSMAGYPEPRQTPLSMAMMDAGYVFANKGGGTYYTYTNKILDSNNNEAQDPMSYKIDATTTIKIPCRKNYVILITDGYPCYDWLTDTSKYTGTYLGGKAIHNPLAAWATGDYDADKKDPTPLKKTLDPDDMETSDCGWGATHYLDDVAKILFDRDIRDDLTGKQIVKVYTIGFGNQFGGDTDENKKLGGGLLYKTAYQSGGKSQIVADQTVLGEFCRFIMSDIMQDNASFVAPVVPISKVNKVYSGNSMYVVQFKPEGTGIWKGNLKKFGIDETGDILQKDGSSAVNPDTGQILQDATSLWQQSNGDALNVLQGGAGAQVRQQAYTNSARDFFTHKDGTNLNATPTAEESVMNFEFSTTAVTNLDFDNCDGSCRLSNDEITDLVNYLKASGGQWKPRFGYDNDWVIGDIVHSRPAVLNAGAKNILFFGSNDGWLHCLEDDEIQKGNTTDGRFNPGNLSDDVINEKWRYVPWSKISNLKYTHPYLKTDNRFMNNTCSPYTGTEHFYFVDGAPTIYPAMDSSGNKKMLMTFGFRRGGGRYITLSLGTWKCSDSTDTNCRMREYDADTGGWEGNKVKWWWEHTNTFLKVQTNGANLETLGQSFGKPKFGAFNDGSGKLKDVLVMPGGYDQNNEDPDPPTSKEAADNYINLKCSTTQDGKTYAPCPKGRAIYLLNAYDGSYLSDYSVVYDKTKSKEFDDIGFNYSIVDVSVFDRKGENEINCIYAGDLGGSVFALRNDRTTNHIWEKIQLFNVKKTGAYLKIFYAPDVVLSKTSDGTATVNYDYVLFGTGDREHPNNTTTVNGFYAVKNRWAADNSVQKYPMDESKLVNVTDYSTYTSTVLANLKSLSTNGWYILFGANTGEKLINAPVTVNGIVYFSTFVPYVPEETGNPCETEGLGYSRVWVLDYQTGQAVYDFNGDGAINASDRYFEAGDGMVAGPTLFITKTTIGALIHDGDILKFIKDPNGMPANKVKNKRGIFYWKEY